MRVISPKKLREFWAFHPDAESALRSWYKLTRGADWKSYEDVRAVFGKRIDQFERFVIFDIGGNKYRLIGTIHYNTGRLYIRHVLTHADYDREKWKED